MRFRTDKSCWQQDITKREWGWMTVKALGVTASTAWLYYRTFWMVIVLLPLFWWHIKLMEQELERKKEMDFLIQFKEAVQALSAALNTGYSIENGVKEMQKELRLIYSDDARISRELAVMVRGLKVQIPVDQIFTELADRVQTEDVRSFVTVFTVAKKSGGDMIAIIRNTVNQIADKIDVKREIDTILAAKKYEFRVMSMIPYGIIGYMTISFPEFMEGLYGNILGIGVMTGCLVIYLGAYYLGLKLTKIEV